MEQIPFTHDGRDFLLFRPKPTHAYKVRWNMNGRRVVRSTKSKDKREARWSAEKLYDDERLRVPWDGRCDPDLRVGVLIEEWKRATIADGYTEAHAEKTVSRVRKICTDDHLVREITPRLISTNLRALDCSAATRNAYRTALRIIFRWAIREGCWEGADPTDRVKPAKVVGKTRRRRALTVEELRALVDAAPEPRASTYLLAATTGLRRSELRALEWSDVDLDACTFTVREKVAKNSKRVTLPLLPDAVSALERLRDHSKGTRILRSVPVMTTFKQDLAAAGIAYVAQDGGTADFHALRATFVTNRARAGVTLQEAQRMARHSTPTLTANTYTALDAEDLRRAADAGERVTTPATTDAPNPEDQGPTVGFKIPIAIPRNRPPV